MRLLELLETITQDQLTESRKKRFQMMVDAVPDLMKFDIIYEDLRADLSWAMNVLKREDRIVWFMRLVRLGRVTEFNDHISQSGQKRNHITNEVGDKDRFNQLYKELEDWIDHEVNRIISKTDYTDFNRLIPDVQTLTRPEPRLRFEHFMSMAERIPEIENYQFGSQTYEEIFTTLRDIELRWQEERKGEIDMSEDTDAEKIIQFPDDSAWWDLNRHSCHDEADAMGHCGNDQASANSGDTLLSYRVYNPKTGRWSPHLTFVLDQNGYLGEMKGRNNDKPVERYHPYIVELLKQDYIKGIKGGGYEAENNFAISDLGEAYRSELLSEKPHLGSFREIYETFGDTDVFRERLETFISQNDLPPVWFEEQAEGIRITPYYSNFVTFVRHYIDSDEDVFWSTQYITDDADPYEAITHTIQDTARFFKFVHKNDYDLHLSIVEFVYNNIGDDIGTSYEELRDDYDDLAFAINKQGRSNTDISGTLIPAIEESEYEGWKEGLRDYAEQILFDYMMEINRRGRIELDATDVIHERVAAYIDVDMFMDVIEDSDIDFYRRETDWLEVLHSEQGILPMYQKFDPDMGNAFDYQTAMRILKENWENNNETD